MASFRKPSFSTEVVVPGPVVVHLLVLFIHSPDSFFKNFFSHPNNQSQPCKQDSLQHSKDQFLPPTRIPCRSSSSFVHSCRRYSWCSTLNFLLFFRLGSRNKAWTSSSCSNFRGSLFCAPMFYAMDLSIQPNYRGNIGNHYPYSHPPNGLRLPNNCHLSRSRNRRHTMVPS